MGDANTVIHLGEEHYDLAPGEIQIHADVDLFSFSVVEYSVQYTCVMLDSFQLDS